MGVREVLVALITLVLCIVALVRPRIGLYGFVWYSLMRPEYLAYSNGSIPYSPALAACVLLGSLRHFVEFPAILRNPVSRTLVLLQIPIVISVFLALVPALCYERFFAYERTIIMVLLIPVLIRTVEQIRTLFLVIAISLGVIGLKIGVEVLAHGGYHITNGYAFMENNQLAATLAMIIPFLWYTRQTVESKPLRLAFLAMLFGSISTVILTTSRGGSLAMLTALLLMISRSRNKVRNFALLALCMTPVLFVFGSEFLARMETLKDPTAESSAYSRLVMYRAALRASQDYPLHGVGFGNLNFIRIYPRYVNDESVAELGIKVHETYLQMLIDTGIFGLLLFVYLLFGTIYRMWRSQKVCRIHFPGTEIYPLAIMTSLIAAAQYGLTGGIERYDLLYIILMCGASWHAAQGNLYDRHAAEEIQTTEVVAPA